MASGNDEALNPRRAVAQTLDALVRAQRQRAAGAEVLAQKALLAWATHPEVVLEVEPHLLRLGELVLRAPEGTDEYRWLLPASLAGLCTLGLDKRTRLEDILRLGRELAALEASNESVSRFQTWLWACGAEGFLVGLVDPAAWAVDEAFEDLKTQRKALAVARVGRAQALAGSHQNSPPPAAGSPLAVLVELLDSGGLKVSAEAQERLAQQALDPYFLVDSELELVFAYPELEACFPAGQTAHRILDALPDDGALLLLGLLASMIRRGSNYAKELAKAIQQDPRALELARQIRLSPRALEALKLLLAEPPTPFSSVLVLTVLAQANADETLGEALATAIISLGLQTIAKHLEYEEISPEAGLFLAKVVSALRSSDRLAQLLEKVPVGTAMTIARNVPPAMLASASHILVALMKRAGPEDLLALVRGLAKGDRAALRVLGQAMLASGADGWTTAAIQEACPPLVKGGFGELFLLPLVQNRKLPVWSRVAICKGLEDNEELLAKAVEFKVSEMLEPAELRDCFSAARKKLAGGH